MTEPVRVGEALPGVLAEVVQRAGHGYDRWMELVAQAGYCSHPVRLCGRVEHANAETGEVHTVYDSDREPDGVLLKGCGNRRASVCPSCSATYQADQYQLLAAGLRGGKGIPDSVSGHPRLFVTFTAPSFGQVHSRKAQGRLVYPCQPYRQGQRCPHGRRVGCWHRHEPDDPRLGEPLCPRCYQAGAQVLWNALAARLWSRTTIYLYRALAQLVGISEGELRRLVRISFAKVAEYQRRGAVHFHAIIRLDAATNCACPACVAPPPAGFIAELLEQAVRQTAATVTVPCPSLDDDQAVTLTARWGEQLDVRHITADEDGDLSAEQVAGYVAKYATKGAEALGVTLDHRVKVEDLEGLDVPAHVAELVRACWELGARPGLARLRLRRGRTCWASAATSRPKAAATPPPLARYGGPGWPSQSVGAVAIQSRWMRGAVPRTTRPWSWLPPGGMSARAIRRPGRRGWLPRPLPAPVKSGASPGRSYEPPRSPHEEQAGGVGPQGMERLLTVAEVAEWLGTTSRHVRRLVFERRIAYRKLGSYVRFHPDDVAEYVAAHRVEAGTVAAGRRR